MQYLKSYEDFVLGLYDAILLDIAEYYPELRVDCSRDSNRLHSAVKHHGLVFLLDDLVCFGKHFDKCLSEGRLTPSSICHFGGYRRGGSIPKLFKGLILRVFDDNALLDSCPDVRAIKFLRQLFFAAKRIKLNCPDSKSWEQVNEFIKTESEVRQPSLSWSSPDFSPGRARGLHIADHCLPRLRSESDSNTRSDSCAHISRSERQWRDDVLQRTFDLTSALIGCFKATDWRFRHGPGAVSRPDYEGYKFLPSYWPTRLERCFPYDVFAHANYSLWADHVHHHPGLVPISDEIGARLLCVPKTYRAPRLIAAEPTAHQWAQQSILDFLVARVSKTHLRHSIFFRDQTQNGRLALESSKTGQFATVDLSAASDRLSCWLVERFFRNNSTLLDALQSCRTLEVEQVIDKKQPKNINLRKFSTMGSAVTFPIQSIVFCTIAIASILIHERRPINIKQVQRAARRVRVFGDDIIIPTDCLDVLKVELTRLGLKVNYDKTFGIGKFRESCGVDAYDGYDVTPVYTSVRPFKSKPESILSNIDVHNNFLLEGYEHVSKYIRRTVSSVGRYAIPEVATDSGQVGWISFTETGYNERFRSRYNPNLCRREYRIDRPRGRTTRVPPTLGAGLLEYFGIPQTKFIRSDRLGVPVRRRSFVFRKTWDAL